MFPISIYFEFPPVDDAEGRLFPDAVPLTGGDAIASPASLVRTGDGKGSDTMAEFMDPRTMGIPTEACNAGVSTFAAGIRGEGFSTSSVTAEWMFPSFSGSLHWQLYLSTWKTSPLPWDGFRRPAFLPKPGGAHTTEFRVSEISGQ